MPQRKDIVKNVPVEYNDIVQLFCNPKEDLQFFDYKEPISFTLRTFDEKVSITRSQWNKIKAAGDRMLDELETEQAKRQ